MADRAIAKQHAEHETTTGLSNTKLAMWVFLASECMLFGALITTYVLYRGASIRGPYPSEIFDIGYTSVSSNTSCRRSLSSRALSRSYPKGFSTTSRRHPLPLPRPAAPSPRATAAPCR